MNIHVNDENIIFDQFLSEQLEKDVFRVIIKKDYNQSNQKMIEDLQSKNVFLYCKIPVENMQAMGHLSALKFQLVETNVTLEKDILMEEEFTFHNEIRLANSQDEEQTVNVAAASFEYSRFHADVKVSKQKANKIKAEWVRNYFKGQRGTDMVIGVIEDRIAGFLQLLKSQDTLVIDLIAVDPGARNKKMATDMINYAQQYCRGRCVKYRVGTQLVNIPSLNLYQDMGFRIKNKEYVLHYHS